MKSILLLSYEFPICIYSDAGKDVSWVLMWPMYTSLNMFMGCFLMNGIVQYVLVVRPSLIPDSWNDKFVAWGGMSFVWMFFILASGIMHCNGILPPSYFSLRGIDHDLSEQAAIVLRRSVLVVCLAIICPLRIIISINPQRSFYSTIVQKLTCFRILDCSKKAERDAGNDDNDNHSIYSKPEIDKKESEPSNQVISNGTLFFWSICWFVGMSLRWIYGDKDLFIADFCSILIFYVYPLLIISTNSNIQQFLKRRMVFLYHRCLQDIFWCMLVVKYFSALGCCRQIKHEDDKESIITVTNGVSGQWAMKIPQDNIESEETHAEFHIENESNISKVYGISGSSYNS